LKDAVIELRRAIEELARNEVEFIIVGGVAMYLHGSAHVTLDLDICYDRRPANLKRIVAALAPYRPRLRGLPEDLPSVWDEQTLRSGTSFTLTTDIGDIDLLGEVAGVGTYADSLAASVSVPLYGVECRVLTLDSLIASKRAAGRTKDLLALPELEALREVAEENE
jgi:predicted nucleotidyltransferase